MLWYASLIIVHSLLLDVSILVVWKNVHWYNKQCVMIMGRGNSKKRLWLLGIQWKTSGPQFDFVLTLIYIFNFAVTPRKFNISGRGLIKIFFVSLDEISRCWIYFLLFLLLINSIRTILFFCFTTYLRAFYPR